MANSYDGFNRVIGVTDSIGNGVNNTFDPGGRNIQQSRLGYPNGATPVNRTGTNNVPLKL